MPTAQILALASVPNPLLWRSRFHPLLQTVIIKSNASACALIPGSPTATCCIHPWIQTQHQRNFSCVLHSGTGASCSRETHRAAAESQPPERIIIIGVIMIETLWIAFGWEGVWNQSLRPGCAATEVNGAFVARRGDQCKYQCVGVSLCICVSGSVRGEAGCQ